MARTDPQVNIRMPIDLKEKLEAASARSKRSLNAEIVTRLSATLEQRGARAMVYGPQMTGLSHELDLAKAENNALKEQIKASKWAANAQSLFLRFALEMVPNKIKSSDPVFEALRNFANSTIHGCEIDETLDQALQALVQTKVERPSD
ncbi:Arc family DNA-binding protein [Burkholderia sp. COPS]|nr:Arc family DNA-binding protein [Burkholderia sp. COPS]